jgi:hypothetical protein
VKVAVLRKEPPRILAVVFEPDEEAMEGISRVASQFDLAGSSFMGIGAFSSAMLGYFERSDRDYKRIPVDDQVEVLALTGNVASHEDGVKVHAHVVAGKSDGTAIGGHLISGTVWPTLEVVLTEPANELTRVYDDYVKLPLIDLDKSENVQQIDL